MAHQLHFEDGEAAMMYVGEVPWHRLGTRLENPPTSAEAIKAAKLDWQVVKKPLYAKDDATWYRVPEQYALVREDQWGKEDCTLFATVSDSYQPLQNSEAFSFFDDLIMRKVATYETAGALGKGERVWVLAKLGDDYDVAPNDAVQRYILLFNGHDAQTSVRVLFTPTRVVCHNTLTWALRDAKTQFRAYHGRNMHKRLEQIRTGLDDMLAQYDDLTRSFTSMVKVQMHNGALGQYLDHVFPTPQRRNLTERRYEEVVQETKQRRKRCADLFESGAGNDNPSVRGTLWAAYNGVTEWADHGYNHDSPAQRFRELFFGDIARTKARALERALEIIGGSDAAKTAIKSAQN